MNPKSPIIIFVAVLASLLEIVDTSIVNVALPTMMGNLGATLEDISMVITGYAIANAIVLPVSSWVSEKIGRRKYYLGCISAFTVTSIACGLAPNLETLIIFRIFQGLMGGALLPTSQALIYEQFPKEKAGMAGAIFGMSVMIGPALGPVLGGYLTDQFGWRSIFNINLPLGVLAFVVGSMCIFDRVKTEQEKNESKGFDVFGLILLVLGIGCLQYVLEQGQSDDWFASTPILICSILTIVCLPLFIYWELKTENPIINVRLFSQRIVVSGVGLMIFLGFFLYAVVFVLPVFLGSSFHYTPTQTGLLFIPGSILTAMMMPMIGRLMTAGVNPKLLIFIGLTGVEICLLTMTGYSPQSSRDHILNSLYLRGFAMAFLFVPINSSILSQFKGAALGQVSGLLNLFRQLGGSSGVALVATLLAKNSSQNFLDLSSHVSLLNPSTQVSYYGALNSFSLKMSSSLGITSPLTATLKSFYGRIQAQVFMLSFNQLIWTIMILFSLSYIPLYFLVLKSKTIAPVDAH